MYGIALMHLAHLVGLRQVDIAEYLGITSVQANHWAKGIRPIPATTLPTLVKRIAEALERSLATGKTDMQIAVPGQPDAQRHPTRADLAPWLNACFTENFMRHGYKEYPSITALLKPIEAYSKIPLEDPRNAVELARLTHLMAQAHLMLTMCGDLRQLVLLLSDKAMPLNLDLTEDSYADTHGPE